MLPDLKPDSVEKERLSILAIVETILAVVVYWAIAWIWDTHIHLLTSIIVAPLLLLRSPESTNKGVKWFGNYLENEKQITPHETPMHYLGYCLGLLALLPIFVIVLWLNIYYLIKLGGYCIRYYC